MSHSKRGAKAPGYEYWSARPGNASGGLPGRATKTNTSRRERRDGDKQVRRELKDA